MSTAYTGEKVKMSFWQIWNMCFGFFGIQFGWSLQMGNMSAIYEFLGAAPDEIPGLWLAAPMTGLIIQPIVGYLSDRTWHPKLGRRRPFFFNWCYFKFCIIVCDAQFSNCMDGSRGIMDFRLKY